jgi:hypothetical protein
MSLHAAPLPRKKKKPVAALPKCDKSSALLESEKSANRVKAKKYRFMRKQSTGTLGSTQFPPEPLSVADEHRILTGSSRAAQPDRFEEAGCAVCGRLTLKTELTGLNHLNYDMSCLQVPGVTGTRAISFSDPIEELEGPILVTGCTDICVECETSLRKSNLLLHALARHGWVGEVPPELQGLSYAEGLFIARVCHNRCVIRVNSGRVRMNANAIMFAQPVLKVYMKLPPSREEMEEVLAIVFTGSGNPTPEDFERTPLLVRRDKVAAALEWLKLNHEYYADLEISQENLHTPRYYCQG